MNRAYIYARTSSKKQQGEDRQSIDSQIALAKQFLVNYPEYELQDTIIDAASAYRGSHLDAGLGEFLKKAERGEQEGDLLIVVYTDRLTRLPIDDAFALLKRLAVCKVNLAITSLGQLIRYNDPLEFGLRMTLTALFHLSHSDSSIKSARVRAAFDERLEKIKEGTHKKSKGLPAWITLEDGEYILKQSHKDIIRRIFELKISGVGVFTITKILLTEGVEAFTDRGWSITYVTFLLRNAATYGAYQRFVSFHEVNAEGKRVRKSKPSGEPVEGYYPAAVTKEIFDAAEYSFQLGHNKGRRNAIKNPFRGLLKCIHCGFSMVINTSGPRTYLRCQRARDGVGIAICPKSNRVRFDMIQERILKAVASLNLQVVEAARPKKQAIKARIAKVEKVIERHYRIISDSDDDAMVERSTSEIKTLNTEKRQLEQELLAASSTIPAVNLKDLESDPQGFNRAMLEVFEYIRFDKRYMAFKLRGFFGVQWDELVIDWDEPNIEQEIADKLEFMQIISEFKVP